MTHLYVHSMPARIRSLTPGCCCMQPPRKREREKELRRYHHSLTTHDVYIKLPKSSQVFFLQHMSSHEFVCEGSSIHTSIYRVERMHREREREKKQRESKNSFRSIYIYTHHYYYCLRAAALKSSYNTYMALTVSYTSIE